MTKTDLIAMAESTAKAQGVDPALLKALCHHESVDWQVWAVRYEPAFYEKYTKPMALSDTEEYTRAISYGLTQIMGETAREFGFKGKYLAELLDPAVNLQYGCQKLARCLKQHPGDVRAALNAYNGGGNQQYPDLVLQHLGEYQ